MATLQEMLRKVSQTAPVGCKHHWKSYSPQPYSIAYYCEYCKAIA